jgi:hypothetical protein
MSVIQTVRSYIAKMLTEVQQMKALIMDEDTVRPVGFADVTTETAAHQPD